MNHHPHKHQVESIYGYNLVKIYPDRKANTVKKNLGFVFLEQGGTRMDFLLWLSIFFFFLKKKNIFL